MLPIFGKNTAFKNSCTVVVVSKLTLKTPSGRFSLVTTLSPLKDALPSDNVSSFILASNEDDWLKYDEVKELRAVVSPPPSRDDDIIKFDPFLTTVILVPAIISGEPSISSYLTPRIGPDEEILPTIAWPRLAVPDGATISPPTVKSPAILDADTIPAICLL